MFSISIARSSSPQADAGQDRHDEGPHNGWFGPLAAPAAGGDSSSQAGRDSPSVEKQKKRTPAWCDRVLWLPDRQLYQLAYGRGEVAVRVVRLVLSAHLVLRECGFAPAAAYMIATSREC